MKFVSSVDIVLGALHRGMADTQPASIIATPCRATMQHHGSLETVLSLKLLWLPQLCQYGRQTYCIAPSLLHESRVVVKPTSSACCLFSASWASCCCRPSVSSTC